MSSKTPNPVLNPIAGNTRPQELGLNSSVTLETKHSTEKSPSIVQRAVSKLSNSAPHIGDITSTGHRKLFSLHRKGKGKEAGGKDEEETPRPTQPTSPKDDSPFARSLSPSPASSRPSLERFRGSGSMRAGTQTLIQALQAIPWDDGGDDNEEALHHAIESFQAHLDGGSSDDEDNGKQFQLSSSIHAIHRPVARSRKGATPLASKGGVVTSSGAYFDGALLSEEEEESDEDDHADEGDFETRRDSQPPTFQRPAKGGVETLRMSMSRSTSLATVRIQRRARLAEKLKDVFGIKGINEVVAEMPCWLLRSVLLQGYMYLTNAHLCFFAHMPSREDQILKSGNLSKKTQRTKRWIKHWFVLKNDVLSWYESSADPYFPHGAVDLRYAISCESIHDKGIRLRTNQKTVLLHADSIPSRDEWVKAIKKVIFKAQNLGESVKIAIPYSAVLDVEKSTAMDFSETIEVKVVDKGENYAVDSYFFAYFNNLSTALEDIRGAVRAYHHSHPPSAPPDEVQDTTAHRSVVPGASGAVQEQLHSVAPHEPKPPVSSGFKLSSFLRPFSYSTDNTAATAESKPNLGTNDEFTHIETVAAPSAASLPTKLDASADAKLPTAVPETQSLSAVDHTYPPASPLGSTHETTPSAASSWSVPVPNWLNPRSYFTTPQPSESTIESADAGEVKEVVSSMTSSHFSGEQSGEQSFAVLDANDDPHSVADPLVIERFRTAFALDERETLLGSFSGYLFRVLPVYGKIYISTNYFCFRSSQVLTRTRMIIPIRDILAAERSKAFRFTHHGLVVVIKGHEEVFLEFGTSERRNACMDVLEHQLEDCRRRLQSGEAAPPSKGKRDALILEELEPSSLVGEDEPVPPPETMTESLPAVMFTSTSSTFLTFKPQTSLHFTCLTIGSRGDVQPYIALCKGLKADGHRVRIATHAEFKDWIEGHGIEFGYVGGDPAELMRICVENGTFTVSFLREGVAKFRGWIDDLLRTAYDACKGTDVLIESPSAMAGIHIAEALQIPYYRAFTMPWTRTRAYPHAFAVPDRKMGGGYNYMSYVMFDQVFWRGISGQINRWRRDVLGIESTSLDKLEPHKVPFLYNFSPAIVPPPLDWYEWIRVTGYWFLDDPENSSAKKWTPAPELVSFIDSAHAEGKKVVYIGFGSIVVSDPEAMTKCVVEAIKESGVHAILSKGWSDRLSSKNKPHTTEHPPPEPLPSYIYPIESVPHDWLFQRIDAACHHGGAGTTGASLRAGIPTIIKPFFGDQFFWADRVEALGIGSAVRKLTVEHLAEALRSATTDLKQIERARMVGNSIRSENGVTTAIEAIYRDLEYARSLIKKPVPHPPPPAPVAGHSEASHDAGTSTDCTPQPKSPKSPKAQLVHWHKDSKDSTQEGTWEGSSNERPPSEDWSVVDEEGKHSLESERPKLATSPKRSGFASTLSEALGYRSGGK